MTTHKTKVTNEGIEHTIETPRYHYFECVGDKLTPKSIYFTGTFLGGTYIQDLRFVDWLGMMLNNKIVIASDNMLGEEVTLYLGKVSTLSDPFLVVQNIDQEYITSTLFNILTALLTEGSKLKSLEWNS